MPPRDSSDRAYAIQTAIFRSLTNRERFEAAVELSNFTHQLAIAGLRARRSDCTDENINRLLAEALFPQTGRAF
jgi:hypothetical protein